MSIRKALVIARVNLVRLLRDRLGLFFILVLPIIIIVVLGLQFGAGFAPRLGVVAEDPGELGEALIVALQDQRPREWTLRRLESEEALIEAVERGSVDTGIILPDDYDRRLRAAEPVVIRFLAPSPDVAAARRNSLVAAVADQVAVVRAARFAQAQGAGVFADRLQAAERLRRALAPVEVRLTAVGEEIFPSSLLGFAMGAHSQVVLFMFLTSLTGAAQLILSRQLGVSRRMLSTPTSVVTILVGEAAGRFGVAMFQGLFIVLATALAFGVAWGDPLAAGALIVVFGLVGAGAAMLIGAVSNNPDQATAVGVFAGLGIAALGGAMAPPEIFPPVMQAVSRLTPHRWAIDGLRQLVAGGGLVEILPQLSVLLTFAAVLLALATWRFRVSLSR